MERASICVYRFNVLLYLFYETDVELEDFHGLPLSMRNGHSIDGASPGSDLNEGKKRLRVKFHKMRY